MSKRIRSLLAIGLVSAGAFALALPALASTNDAVPTCGGGKGGKETKKPKGGDDEKKPANPAFR
jgi:hypothetical protein